MPRTTTSALLKTQKSRQNEIWGQEDSLKDYEWTLSDKSPEAYAAYVQHYKNRMNSPQADGDKMLTYQKRLSSANKAYTSNEIQRASIDIIEGRQPEEYKIQVLEDMYTQAYQLGDMDLAQSLRYQLDNQYVQQQNRQLLEMAAYGGGGYGGGGYGGSGYGGSGSSAELKTFIADVKAARDDVKAGNFAVTETGLTLNDVTTNLAEFGLNDTIDLLKQFGVETNSPIQFIQASLAGAYEQLRGFADEIPDETEKLKMMSDINAQVNGDTIKIGGKSFNLATLEKMVSDEAEGNPSYRFKQDKNGNYTLEQLDNIKFQFRFDENGVPIKDEMGRNSIFTKYGDNTIAGTGKGYQPDQKVSYMVDKYGNLTLASADKAYDKNGKLKQQDTKGGMYSLDNVLANSGLMKKNGSYLVVDPYLTKQLIDMGFTDSNIDEQNIRVDEYGTITANKDGRLLELYKNASETKPRWIERIATSPKDLIGGRDVKTGLGSLQSNLPGGALQPSNASRILGAPSSVSGVLRQNADTIMANNKEKLRVQTLAEEQQRAANRTVTVANTAPAVQLKVPTVAQQQQQVNNRTVKVSQPAPQRTVAVTPTNQNRTVTVSGPRYTPPPPAPKKQNVVQKAARWFKGLF